MWTCTKCGERVEDSFDVCWACGTDIEGNEDPEFETADDAGPIDDPALRDDANSDLLDVDLAADFDESLPELVDCYQAGNTIEAKFIADQLVLNGIPAVADRQDLNRQALGGLVPTLWGNGPRVRVRREDLGRAMVWVEGYKLQQEARRGRAAGDRGRSSGITFEDEPTGE